MSLDLWIYPSAEEPNKRFCAATADWFQVLGTEVRASGDKTVLYWNPTTSQWVLLRDGSEWSGFTIEPAI